MTPLYFRGWCLTVEAGPMISLHQIMLALIRYRLKLALDLWSRIHGLFPGTCSAPNTDPDHVHACFILKRYTWSNETSIMRAGCRYQGRTVGFQVGYL